MELEVPKNKVIPIYMSPETDEKLRSASIILLFGPSGSGKTSFANVASGDSMGVGNGVKSCTQQVEVSELFYLDEKPVVVVDCPGFDDTYLTEADILQYLVDFLTHVYSNKFELAGLIYMHRIIDPRVGGTSLRHMNMFKAICGVESLKNAVYITNMWSDPPTENELFREIELNETHEFFHGPLTEGAQSTRHLGTRESAHDILRLLLGKGPTVTTLQRQLVDEQMELEDTDVGRLLGQALEEAMLHHQQQVEELNTEQERAAELDNQAWSRRLEIEAKKTEERGRQLAAQLSLLKGREQPGGEQKLEQVKPEGQKVGIQKTEQRKNEPRPASHSASTWTPDITDTSEAMTRLQKMVDESNQKYERGIRRNQVADAKRERELDRQADARIKAAIAGTLTGNNQPKRSSSSSGLRSNAGIHLDPELLISKAFDGALKPTKIIPYYYRALHDHGQDDVTVATIVTSNRFEALIRLVNQYHGPISATVHISSSNMTRRTDLLASLHEVYTSSPLFPRWVDIHLVTDAHDRQFNMWRNLARLYSRTGWILMLDVDFAICTDVRGRFRSALGGVSSMAKLARSERAAFVIPAFEYVVQDEGKDWHMFPTDKVGLKALVEAGKIAMFHRSWAPGHSSTNYEQYYAAQPGEVYKVITYQKAYEPYVIMRRDGPPWCDERFVGYGGNKAACLFSIYLSGIDFYVLPDDFLIHQSHAYAEETRKNERKSNKQVYDNFRKELCLEQISQSIQRNTLHTNDKSNLREECMKSPGVPELVLRNMLKSHGPEKSKRA